MRGVRASVLVPLPSPTAPDPSLVRRRPVRDVLRSLRSAHPDPDRTLAVAHELADVPWLARSRRAYHAWAARLGALLLGSAALLSVLAGDHGVVAMWVWSTLGVVLVSVGLLLGASYGRLVAALVGALEVGCTPTWLLHRVAAREGHPTALAAELEQLAEAQQRWPWSR